MDSCFDNLTERWWKHDKTTQINLTVSRRPQPVNNVVTKQFTNFRSTVKLSRNRFQVPLWLPILVLTCYSLAGDVGWVVYFYFIFCLTATVRCVVMNLRNQNNSLLSENLLSDMFTLSAFEACYQVELGFLGEQLLDSIINSYSQSRHAWPVFPRMKWTFEFLFVMSGIWMECWTFLWKSFSIQNTWETIGFP